MEGAIGTLVILVLMIIAHIFNSIKESAAAAKQQPKNKNALDVTADEPHIISRPKPSKQPKPKKTLSHQQTLRNEKSVFEGTDSYPARQKALIKQLAPQGEGTRFGVDPGTLDTGQIVAPTVDPTVKPDLESMTGIYEQEATSLTYKESAMSLNILDILSKPQGIYQAVILAEILNRPGWQQSETTSERNFLR